MLKEHGEDLHKVEGKIYNVGVKLKRFLEENDLLEDVCLIDLNPHQDISFYKSNLFENTHFFKQAIEAYQKEIDELHSKSGELDSTKERLEQFTDILKCR